VATLEGTQAALEHARALTELGAALRRAGSRAEARDHLRMALDIAHRCGGAVVEHQARQELLAAGARPRTSALTGFDALTPSERRVAELAATGGTNREIAQALFVTPRTVEGHLTNVYAKLGVGSREELAGVVPGATAGPDDG
jgi:DNA-binding CsgD family transcriptional regulator